MDGCLADTGQAGDLHFGESGAFQESEVMVSVAWFQLLQGAQTVAPKQLDSYTVQLVIGKVSCK